MNVGIIGFGAAGSVAAITAARSGHHITVLEHEDKPLKKILATGNGKCNFTNETMGPEFYNEEARSLFSDVYSRFTKDDTIKFFKDIGIEPYKKNGYYYPRSEQAKSVAECLMYEIDTHIIEVITGCEVEEIKQNLSHEFILTTTKGKYTFDRLILATGSNASPKTGSDGSGYGLAIKLGHHVVKPLPALCGLKCSGTDFKQIAGVRCQAKVSLYVDDKFIKSDTGELQITEYGLSGIPIFQISGLALRNIDLKRDVKVSVDYAPEYSDDEFTDFMLERLINKKNKPSDALFKGCFNDKLGAYFDSDSFNEYRERLNIDIAYAIKHCEYKVTGHRGFDNCQVCTGGISLDQIKPSLESTIVDGLYFAGEIIDINGECGGYNLQWAWSSGFVAGLLG